MAQWPGDNHERVARYQAAGHYGPLTLRDYLRRQADRHPDRPAIWSDGTIITFSDLLEAVQRLAGGLRAIGIGHSDVVAVQLPNCPQYIIAFLAITDLGAVMQTLHMPYRAAELAYLLGDSGAKAVVCLGAGGNRSPAAEVVSVTGQLDSLETIICVGQTPDLDCAIRLLAYEDLAASEPFDNSEPVLPGDFFVLLYTSGTTANPKGVPVRYRQFLSNAEGSVDDFHLTPQSVVMSVAPMTHLYGLYVCHLGLLSGAMQALMPAFDPVAFGEICQTVRVNGAFAAPAHMMAALGAGVFENYDLSSLDFICLSGSAVDVKLAETVDDKLPDGGIVQLWGMSELQAGTHGKPADPPEIRLASAGLPTVGTELAIVDDNGKPVATGTEGRLRVRGPSVFDGYLNNEAATKSAFIDGEWFETGDTAYRTPDGALVLTGRTKEIINRGGVKYSPVEIETLIDRMDSVERSAIIPQSDPDLGERACVFVVPAAGRTVTLDDVIAELDRKKVAKYKWPENFRILEAMPLTPTQKIMRGKLRDMIE